MTATILDGKATAATIKEELHARIAALAELGVTPGLGTLLVGVLIVLVSVPASFVISALTIRGVPQVFDNPNPPSTDASPTIMFGRAASKSRMR